MKRNFKLVLGSCISIVFIFLASGQNMNAQNSEENQQSNGTFDNVKATAIYAQTDPSGSSFWGGKKTNLMEASSDGDQKKIATIDGKTNGYRVSPDRANVAVNQGNEVKVVKTGDGSESNSVTVKGEATGMAFSPNSNHLLVWDQNNNFFSREKNYYVHDYDLDKNQDKIIYTGQTDSSYYPYAWRPDGKILMIEKRSGNENVWYFDKKSKEFKQTKYQNPYWISEDGKYAAVPDNYQQDKRYPSHKVYNAYGYENDGYSDSYKGKYQLVDPTNDTVMGQIGNNSNNNSIVSYSIDQDQIIYASSGGNSSTPSYFSAPVGANQNKSATSTPAQEMSQDESSAIGAKTVQKGGMYNVMIGSDTVVSSKSPITIIICYPGQSSKPTPEQQAKAQQQAKAKALQQAQAQSQPPVQNISIGDAPYNPGIAKIKTGMTVVWTNNDKNPQAITIDNSNFDSGIIRPGGKYQQRFLKSGTYNYRSTTSPEMRGVIQVVDSTDDDNS